MFDEGFSAGKTIDSPMPSCFVLTKRAIDWQDFFVEVRRRSGRIEWHQCSSSKNSDSLQYSKRKPSDQVRHRARHVFPYWILPFFAQTITTRKWRTEAVGHWTSQRLGKDHVQVSTRYATADPHGQRRNENSEYLQCRISTGKNRVVSVCCPCHRWSFSSLPHTNDQRK